MISVRSLPNSISSASKSCLEHPARPGHKSRACCKDTVYSNMVTLLAFHGKGFHVPGHGEGPGTQSRSGHKTIGPQGSRQDCRHHWGLGWRQTGQQQSLRLWVLQDFTWPVSTYPFWPNLGPLSLFLKDSPAPSNTSNKCADPSSRVGQCSRLIWSSQMPLNIHFSNSSSALLCR